MTDHSEIERIAARMQSCTKNLHNMAGPVGMAKQCKEFASDMRKMALAVEMAKQLRQGETGTAAEAYARASESYAQRLSELASQLQEAESTIARWQAEHASFEASRSLLSMQKETLRQLDG